MAVADRSPPGVVRMPDEPIDAELIERSRDEPERFSVLSDRHYPQPGGHSTWLLHVFVRPAPWLPITYERSVFPMGHASHDWRTWDARLVYPPP